MLGDLGKLIAAKGLKKLHKVQKIARSGHTGTDSLYCDLGTSLSNVYAEKTHLLCKAKYNCIFDLLFDWFGFDQTCKSLSNPT